MNANDDLPSWVRYVPFGKDASDPRNLMKARIEQMRRQQQPTEPQKQGEKE